MIQRQQKKGRIISFFDENFNSLFHNQFTTTVLLILIFFFFRRKSSKKNQEWVFSRWFPLVSRRIRSKYGKNSEYCETVEKRDLSTSNPREFPLFPDANHDSVTSRWLRYAIRPIKPCSSGLVAAICHWPRERHAKYAFKGSSATGRWSFIPILVTNNSPRDAFGIRVQRGGSPVHWTAARLL